MALGVLWPVLWLLVFQHPSPGSSQGLVYIADKIFTGGGEWITVLSDLALLLRQQESREEGRTDGWPWLGHPSCVTSAIMMPLKLCCFICRVRVLHTPNPLPGTVISSGWGQAWGGSKAVYQYQFLFTFKFSDGSTIFKPIFVFWRKVKNKLWVKMRN